MIRILFVCHANICRSPMAEFICKDLLAGKKCENQFEIDSAAVSRVKEGEKMHPSSFEQLILHGISQNPILSEEENQKLFLEMQEKRARKFRREDYKSYDMILVMDRKIRESLRFSLGDDTEGKIRFLSRYAGISGDILDPWETGDFQKAFEQIQAGCQGLLEELSK